MYTRTYELRQHHFHIHVNDFGSSYCACYKIVNLGPRKKGHILCCHRSRSHPHTFVKHTVHRLLAKNLNKITDLAETMLECLCSDADA